MFRLLFYTKCFQSFYIALHSNNIMCKIVMLRSERGGQGWTQWERNPGRSVCRCSSHEVEARILSSLTLSLSFWAPQRAPAAAERGGIPKQLHFAFTSIAQLRIRIASSAAPAATHRQRFRGIWANKKMLLSNCMHNGPAMHLIVIVARYAICHSHRQPPVAANSDDDNSKWNSIENGIFPSKWLNAVIFAFD